MAVSACENSSCLAGVHETGLLLHAQRCAIVRERAAVDRLGARQREDVIDQRAQRLGHVAVAPIRLAEPVADVQAGAALQIARRPLAQADRSDQPVVQRDRERDLGGVVRGIEHGAHEGLGIVARVGPRRRREPAHHVPVVEQGEDRRGVALAQRPQDQSPCPDLALRQFLTHVTPPASPDPSSSARSRCRVRAGSGRPAPRSRARGCGTGRRRSTGSRTSPARGASPDW